MVLRRARTPLERVDIELPKPSGHELLLEVRACGVCRTDLHIVDGELDRPKLPLVLGHEIVGRVIDKGRDAQRFEVGQRIGVPWLGGTDETCRFCRRGDENLCDNPTFTGYSRDGGYAEYALADERYCLPLPNVYGDVEAAPLLCAGLIGYRTYGLAGDSAQTIGLYGFGAAAHIVAQVAVHQGREVYGFTRPGDDQGQEFARRLGCVWAGGSDESPPIKLDAALIFAPVGGLVVSALESVGKGGVVVCGGIHMSDIPAFPYRLLWEERTLRSVANLTRNDGAAFMQLAAEVRINTSVTSFPLDQANAALEAVRGGTIEGAAVLVS